MKHLRKYNESIESPQDIADYIKLVFADFIDEGSQFDFTEDSDFYTTEDGIGYKVCFVEIKLPHLPDSGEGHNIWVEGDIDDFLKNSKDLVERFEEIKSCIMRVLDKYHNIESFLNKEADSKFKNEVFSQVWVYFKWL